MKDEIRKEQQRKELATRQLETSALRDTMVAKSEAESKAEAMRISSQAAVEKARLEAEAMDIKKVSASLLLLE